MRASAFVYPWDVVGDPEAPRRLAGLGIEQVTLASAYHSTRALTPRHPQHRIVTAPHSAVLYPPSAKRWAGLELRPYRQSWMAAADPWAEAADALAGAGLEVHTWVVLAHNSRLGAEHPGSCVRNAYGDRYPWAPCIARPEVLAYARELAAEAAVRPGAAGTELESCGWYGLAHLHAHDKIGGVPLDGAGQYLMSLCFCDRCEAGYGDLGADPEELRQAVRAALEPEWTRAGAPAPAPDGEWARVAELLGADRAELTLTWRTRTAGCSVGRSSPRRSWPRGGPSTTRRGRRPGSPTRCTGTSCGPARSTPRSSSRSSGCGTAGPSALVGRTRCSTGRRSCP